MPKHSTSSSSFCRVKTNTRPPPRTGRLFLAAAAAGRVTPPRSGDRRAGRTDPPIGGGRVMTPERRGGWACGAAVGVAVLLAAIRAPAADPAGSVVLLDFEDDAQF